MVVVMMTAGGLIQPKGVQSRTELVQRLDES